MTDVPRNCRCTYYDQSTKAVMLDLPWLSCSAIRLPDLQMILGHWGEVALFYVERIASLDRVAGLEHPLSTYLRRNLYI